jgi:hypothetical protein
MKFELTHANMDPLHCFMPGFFRSLKRGDRKKQKLDMQHKYGDGEDARIIGFEPLGADDLRLLYALVAFAGPKGKSLPPEPRSDMARQLRMSLNLNSPASSKEALIVQEPVTKLLKEIGLTDTGNNIRRVKESLIRMSNVTIVITKDTQSLSFSLLSFGIDEKDKRIFVGLNPRIAEVVLGIQRSHTRIELTEVRQLRTDAALLIHLRLCGWVKRKKLCKVALDTLCGYVWQDEAAFETLKKRRQTIRKALAEIIEVGWTVKEYVKGKFEIERP